MPGSSSEVHVGISGWDYQGWQGDFYPDGLPARRRLAHAAEHFDTVEANGTFYALQRPSTYQRWLEATPEGFQFALKGGRFITHLKRLRDVEQGLANFFASGPLVLADKLGPILWQLPATITFDPGLLDDFLGQLPRTTAAAGELAARHDERLEGRAATRPVVDRPIRHALEVRHASYDDARYVDLLARHGVANVVSDSPTWPMFTHHTTDLSYVRLHGHTDLYRSRYDAAAIDHWARRCAAWATDGPVYVYFDNDADGHAPHDAVSLRRRLDEWVTPDASGRRGYGSAGDRSSALRGDVGR